MLSDKVLKTDDSWHLRECLSLFCSNLSNDIFLNTWIWKMLLYELEETEVNNYVGVLSGCIVVNCCRAHSRLCIYSSFQPNI